MKYLSQYTPVDIVTVLLVRSKAAQNVSGNVTCFGSACDKVSVVAEIFHPDAVRTLTLKRSGTPTHLSDVTPPELANFLQSEVASTELNAPRKCIPIAMITQVTYTRIVEMLHMILFVTFSPVKLFLRKSKQEKKKFRYLVYEESISKKGKTKTNSSISFWLHILHT